MVTKKKTMPAKKEMMSKMSTDKMQDKKEMVKEKMAKAKKKPMSSYK
jgi:hypothetical protein